MKFSHVHELIPKAFGRKILCACNFRELNIWVEKVIFAHEIFVPTYFKMSLSPGIWKENFFAHAIFRKFFAPTSYLE